jgi:hypothetical protein
MVDTEIADSKRDPLAFLETLSKAAALVLFVTYVSGFIIVSVHNASYGFTELSPFKPRILSAGVLFFSLILIPVVPAHFIFSPGASLSFPVSLANGLSRCWNYFVSCSIASMALSTIYVDPPSAVSGPNPSRLTIGLYVLGGLLIIIVASIALQSKYYEKYPWPTIAFFTILLTGVLINEYRTSKTYASGAMTMWMFGIGLASLAIRRNVKRGGLWPSDLIFPIVMALSLFPSYLYPRIKYSWGGGQPTSVVVYLPQDSRLFPGQQIEGQLLDESDGGFYVLPVGQDRALYIPRNTVSAVYFSQSPMNLAPPNQKPKL